MRIINLLKTNGYNSFYKFPMRKTLEIIKAEVNLYLNNKN